MELKLLYEGEELQQHAYWNGFYQENLKTKEELVLIRLEKGNEENFHSFLLRRCPIGTGEEEWHSIVEEIHNKFDGGMGKMEIDFYKIGYSFSQSFLG